MAVPVTPRGQSPGPQKHSAFPGVSRIHQENNRISSRHASAVETGIVAIDASVASTMEIREISVIARHGRTFCRPVAAANFSRQCKGFRHSCHAKHHTVDAPLDKPSPSPGSALPPFPGSPLSRLRLARQDPGKGERALMQGGRSVSAINRDRATTVAHRARPARILGSTWPRAWGQLQRTLWFQVRIMSRYEAREDILDVIFMFSVPMIVRHWRDN